MANITRYVLIAINRVDSTESFHRVGHSAAAFQFRSGDSFIQQRLVQRIRFIARRRLINRRHKSGLPFNYEPQQSIITLLQYHNAICWAFFIHAIHRSAPVANVHTNIINNG